MSRCIGRLLLVHGWMIYDMGQDMVHGLWYCTMVNLKNGGNNHKSCDEILTEELAELHAILQAIDWERNNG